MVLGYEGRRLSSPRERPGAGGDLTGGLQGKAEAGKDSVRSEWV